MKLMDENRKNYLKNYRKEHLKRVAVDFDFVTYSRLVTHSQDKGESVSGFIKRAVKETILRESFADTEEMESYKRDAEAFREIRALILGTDRKGG